MNTCEFDNQLRHLATLPSCSEQEIQELIRLFENEPSFRDQAIDERVLDALLQFESESADQREEFIRQCLSRIPVDEAKTAKPRDQFGFQLKPTIRETRHPQGPAISQDSHRTEGAKKSRQTLAISISLAAILLVFLGAGIWHSLSQVPDTGQSVEIPQLKPTSPIIAKSAPIEGEPAEPLTKPSGEDNSTDLEIVAQDVPQAGDRDNLKRPNIPPEKVVLSEPEAAPSTHDSNSNQPALSLTPLTFAEWTPVRSSASDPMPAPRRLGQGPFTTNQPTSRLRMDNGTTLFLQGPFSGQLVDADSLSVKSGSVYLETEPNEENFHLLSPGTQWLATNNTDLQLNIDPAGQQECFIFKGQVRIERPAETESLNTIALTPKGLNQVLIEPGDETGLPTILAARGRRNFLGQVGFPASQEHRAGQGGAPIWQTDSPEYFSRLVNQLVETRNQPRDDLFFEHWLSFVQQTKELDRDQQKTPQPFEQVFQQFIEKTNPRKPGQKKRDDLFPGTTQFQGSININGKEQKFDSLEEFNRARQAGNLQNPLQPGNLPNRAQAFQGEINLNGRPFRFSTPQQFNSMRRRARR